VSLPAGGSGAKIRNCSVAPEKSAPHVTSRGTITHGMPADRAAATFMNPF
jgi:hypothetical protein